MKKLFTLFLSALFTTSIMAYDGSRLSISTVKKGLDLKVEVDGRSFNMNNNSITFKNIREGYHTIKIYREYQKSGNGKGKKKGIANRREMIYNGSIYVKRGFHSDITINRFGKVLTDEQAIDYSSDWYSDDDDEEEDYDLGNGTRNNGGNGNNGGYGNGNNGGTGNNGGFGNTVSSQDFEMMKETLRKEWLENARLATALSMISRSSFSSQQVKEMMLLFTFEKNKLEIAKAAYRGSYDKQNYYLVREALTFNASKDELDKFMRESR